MLRILIVIIGLGCATERFQAQTSDRDQLRAALDNLGKRDAIAKETTLAVNGNSYAQKKLLCDTEYARDPAIRQDGIEALRRTGGWFAIREFSSFLPNTTTNTAITAPKGPGSDVRFLARRYYAMKFLPDVIRNSPFKPTDSELVSRSDYWAEQWERWIRDHQSELSQLEPRGPDRVPTKQECSREFGHYEKYK